MTEFLKSETDLQCAKAELKRRGWPLHKWNEFKNWDSVWCDSVMRDGDLLDIGCVTSMPLFIAEHLRLNGKKVGIDPVLEYRFGTELWERPKTAEIISGKAEQLPFNDNSFDNVTCLSVIEHNVEQKAFVSELNRIMRPDGRFVITFDFWPEKAPDRDVLIWPDLLMLRDRLSNHFVLEPMDYTLGVPIIDKLFTFGCIRGIKK